MPLTKAGHWEIRFTADEINGWLAVDLVKNHPNALPPTLKDPRVSIDPNEYHRGGLSIST